MTPRRTFTLHNGPQAWTVLTERVYGHCKPWLAAGHRLVVRVMPWTRSLEQNSTFHGICSALAKSGIQHAGRNHKTAQWKVLIISGHAVATDLGADIIPGLEGEFVNIRESSADMGVKRMSSVIEYGFAYCALRGVEVHPDDCAAEPAHAEGEPA